MIISYIYSKLRYFLCDRMTSVDNHHRLEREGLYNLLRNVQAGHIYNIFVVLCLDYSCSVDCLNEPLVEEDNHVRYDHNHCNYNIVDLVILQFAVRRCRRQLISQCNHERDVRLFRNCSTSCRLPEHWQRLGSQARYSHGPGDLLDRSCNRLALQLLRDKHS